MNVKVKEEIADFCFMQKMRDKGNGLYAKAIRVYAEGKCGWRTYALMLEEIADALSPDCMDTEAYLDLVEDTITELEKGNSK